MFPLTVHSLICYLTAVDGVVWRQEDHLSNKMVKCLKGEAINGYFEVKVSGRPKVFKEENKEEFIDVLCGNVAKKITSLIGVRFTIIPVPNSSATTSIKADFRTYSIAKRIAQLGGSGAHAVAALRWKTAMLSSRKGGSRDLQVLHDNLELMHKPVGPIILFDDVMTTGAHMKACQRKLMEAGITPTQAISVGRATWDQKEKPIGWVEEVLQVETSSSAWDIDF